ncbi:MAG: ribosome-associated heat shock protein Hsp15 [Kiritimatiellia bacterium]|jgi:ribosome-associated heat shock protein Hsp15
MAKSTASEKNSDLRRLRLDKWLWAARFYKTRSVAKQAIDNGKVYCEGSRCKPGKEVEIGMEVRLRQGFDEKTVIIKALSEQRRGAPEAQLLYEETEESAKTRLEQAAQRKAQPSLGPSAGKPNKKDRRLIHRFKHI